MAKKRMKHHRYAILGAFARISHDAIRGGSEPVQGGIGIMKNRIVDFIIRLTELGKSLSLIGRVLFPDGWADFSIFLALTTGAIVLFAREWFVSHFYLFLPIPLIISCLYVRFLYLFFRRTNR